MTSLRRKRRMTPFAPHSTHLSRPGGSSGLNRVLSVRKRETIAPWGMAVAQEPSTEQLALQTLLPFPEHNLWASPCPAATLPTAPSAQAMRSCQLCLQGNPVQRVM